MIPLKINGPLVILFYIFASVESFCYIVAAITRIVNPDEIFYNYEGPPEIDVAPISKNLANFFGIALGFIVLITMFQITVSIQILSLEINVKQANCRRHTMTAVAVITLLIYLGGEVAIYVVQSLGTEYLNWLEGATTIFLGILFSITIAYFLRNVKLYQGLAHEKRSIQNQFIFFCIAYVTKSVYCIYQIVWPINDWIAAAVLIFLWIPWHILPQSYVYYRHHRTYRRMLEAREVTVEFIDKIKAEDFQEEVVIRPSRFIFLKDEDQR